MFAVVGLGGARKGKENDREWIIPRHIASVHDDGTRKCPESYWTIGVGVTRKKSDKEVSLVKVQYMHSWNTMANPLWTINTHLKNDDQVLSGVGVSGRGGWMERGKKAEYEWCILYTCMKIEKWNQLKFF
jgi:hypothetical protein